MNSKQNFEELGRFINPRHMRNNFKMEEKYKKLREAHEELLREREFHRELMRVLMHDLKSPMNVLGLSESLLERYLNEIEKSKTAEERTQIIFNARRMLRTIGSSGREAANISEILALSEVSYDELKINSVVFRFPERVQDVIQAYEHQLITKKKSGIQIAYSPEIESLDLKTNIAAFSSMLSNLFGNSIQYAEQSSLIKALSYCEDENFIFELENMVPEPIDAEKIMHIFRKGYRINKSERDEQYRRNEGLGLYFVEKLVKRGYNGEINVSSGNSFKITEERTKDMVKKDYGIIYPGCYTPLPSFHTKVSIPLKTLSLKEEKEKPKAQSIEDVTNEENDFQD